jgi:hypothetical protein
MQEYRFNVFGTLVAIVGAPGAWQAFYLGAEGKRRAADFIVPHDIAADALAEYLDDLFHEDATPRHNAVTRVPCAREKT